MRRGGPNYIWTKLTTPAWLRKHELALDQKTDGAHAIVENPTKARLRIEHFCEDLAYARSLKAIFGGSIRRLPANWEAKWLGAPRLKPLRVGNRLAVTSDPAKAGANSLVIPASVAFGTGEHATTAMSLRLLERYTRKFPPDWRMLDAGTGSGILALAGSRFGARSVLAIDNDPLAIKTAKWNALQNGIRSVKFVVGDVEKLEPGAFEFITANLYSELLRRVLPRFRKALTGDGYLILSGVLRDQEPDLLRALRRATFRVIETRRRGKWIALAAR